MCVVGVIFSIRAYIKERAYYQMKLEDAALFIPTTGVDLVSGSLGSAKSFSSIGSSMKRFSNTGTPALATGTVPTRDISMSPRSSLASLGSMRSMGSLRSLGSMGSIRNLGDSMRNAGAAKAMVSPTQSIDQGFAEVFPRSQRFLKDHISLLGARKQRRFKQDLQMLRTKYVRSSSLTPSAALISRLGSSKVSSESEEYKEEELESSYESMSYDREFPDIDISEPDPSADPRKVLSKGVKTYPSAFGAAPDSFSDSSDESEHEVRRSPKKKKPLRKSPKRYPSMFGNEHQSFSSDDSGSTGLE